VLASITNFLAFFGRDLFYRARYGHRKMQKQSAELRTRDKPTHICAVCGVTDKERPHDGVPLLHEMLATARLLHEPLCASTSNVSTGT